MTLAERLRATLEAGMARETVLIPRDGPLHDSELPEVEAAVLVAVTDRADPGVILTQRPETMRKHAGQVAFPGGRRDPEDVDLVAAALREAEEEIGLSPHLIELVGLADQYRTITSYVVTPVIGVIAPDLDLVPNDDEVESIFEVPLAFLLDPANHGTQAIDWEGTTRHYYEINWQDRRIWGATAAMIVNLSRRLQWPG